MKTLDSFYVLLFGDYLAGVEEPQAVQLRSPHLYLTEHLFKVLLLPLELVLKF